LNLSPTFAGLVLYFLRSRFHFTPQVVVLLFFSCSFWWTVWLSNFSKTVFKIILGFAVLTFFVAVLGGQY